MKIRRAFLVALIAFTGFNAVAQDEIASAIPAIKKSGKAEKPFSVIERGALLTKVSFRKETKAVVNTIEIQALNVNGGSISLGNYSNNGNPVVPPAYISDITTINGNYQSRRNISQSGRGVVLQLIEVIYPYKARINVSDEVLEFEITEPGFWKINIDVIK